LALDFDRLHSIRLQLLERDNARAQAEALENAEPNSGHVRIPKLGEHEENVKKYLGLQ
jgi:hypothetical protein